MSRRLQIDRTTQNLGLENWKTLPSIDSFQETHGSYVFPHLYADFTDPHSQMVK